MRYKNWSTDKDELPLDGSEPLEIFKVDGDGNQITPVGQPSVVTPEFDRKMNIELVQRNLERIKDYLTWAEYQWWEKFFKDPPSCIDSGSESWYLNHLQPCETVIHAAPQSSGAGSILSVKMQRERSIPEVTN